MSPQALSKPRRKRRKPQSIGKPKPSKIILYGKVPRVHQVEKALRGLDVERVTTDEFPTVDETTLAVVVVAPLPGKKSAAKAVEALRTGEGASRNLPIFAVVDTRISDRMVRTIYSAGASAVFHWSREVLLLQRLVAELLGVALVRGRAKQPQVALGRTLTAHLRLVPWSTAGVKAIARGEGEVELSGSISSYWRKRELEKLVARVPGVTRILSSPLRVEPSGRSDRQISHSVRATFRNTAAVDDATISVSVAGGVVKLGGAVSGRREMARILELLANVAGVREIDNQLIVSNKIQRRDGATARRLTKALSRWFPAERVRVKVFAQVAVLTGKVKGLSSSKTLEEFIGEDPTIVRVVNKLDVT